MEGLDKSGLLRVGAPLSSFSLFPCELKLIGIDNWNPNKYRKLAYGARILDCLLFL